jgi:hypothetical protein
VLHWETLYDFTGFERQKLARLRCYLENKTLRLKQAFQLLTPAWEKTPSCGHR